ncbi:YidB family protein [Proteus mirabilis]|uniref:YidB family protein n=1 Tax=Proteus mirabilis TaxID=584 RepID=UPI002349AB99|nr:YidB family protein [Proteus mirabilis]MDC5896992.1 YidB family protein [Proteus mirabilis]MDC5900469.1 YidB family protein [Proteus mirabilis]MDC5918125.1 YidB family protein [Proteus mirabilis]MDC5928645.1 YidB family protein [Proteus mirabilis]MDC5935682.1 YidB family protein [Proteus mirabilis]
MSLFNQITSLLGGEKINQFKTVLEWVETQGGIEGLVKQFNSAGLSELIQSWISTGSNLPINAEQIVQVFSSPVINELAAKINMNTAEASDMAAQYLPKLVDKLTPEGVIPKELDLMSAGMDMLKAKIFGG